MNFANDIAMLYLTSDVTLNNWIQIACLPAASTSYPPMNSYVYGVGWATYNMLDLLYNAKLTVDNINYCTYDNSFNDTGMVCAGEPFISLILR